MKKNPVIIDPNMKNGYIPAPYVLEEGDKINDMYLEPVLFHNENGPTIGVTLLGVIEIGGQYFRDLNNNKELDTFEDWRLDADTRAEAFAAAVTMGYDYFNCCCFSSAVSALKCTGIGARESVPNLETTKKFLKENGYEF